MLMSDLIFRCKNIIRSSVSNLIVIINRNGDELFTFSFNDYIYFDKRNILDRATIRYFICKYSMLIICCEQMTTGEILSL